MNYNSKEPAFPVIETKTDEHGEPEGVLSKGGLTKREFLAAFALQGILGNQTYMVTRNSQGEDAAELAVRYADSLLDRLGHKDEYGNQREFRKTEQT